MLHPGGSFTPHHHDDESIRSSTEHFLSAVEATEPVQIPKRKPRRRLFSGGSISEEEEICDSGIDSPAHRENKPDGIGVSDVIREEELDNANLNDCDDTLFLFEDEIPRRHATACFFNHAPQSHASASSSNPNLCYSGSNQMEEPWYRQRSLTLDVIPHDRVSLIHNQHTPRSSRQFAALCSPAYTSGYAPQLRYRQRSFSQQSASSHGDMASSPSRRVLALSNQSLFSYGSPVHVFASSHLSQDGSFHCSTPQHEGRQRSTSGESNLFLLYVMNIFGYILKGFQGKNTN